MPTFVIRKKLRGDAVIDMNIRLWGLWSDLSHALDKKRVSRKLLLNMKEELCRLASKCEIRIPRERKRRDTKNTEPSPSRCPFKFDDPAAHCCSMDPEDKRCLRPGGVCILK